MWPGPEPVDALRLEEAVPLGYALVARAARDAGVRALAIKGPVLELQGLRSGHQSRDVDVLVEPSGREALTSRLAALGWTAWIESSTVNVLPQHSEPLKHPAWPVELDLHDRFPGFLAEPAAVFSVLWQSRSAVTLVGASIECTDRVGSAAIAALHVLRDPVRRADAFEDLCVRIDSTLDAADRHRLSELAARTGAVGPLAPLFERLGLSPAAGPDASDPDAAAVWSLGTALAGEHSVAWVHELLRTPVAGWPGLLRRALLLTEPEIRFLYGDLAPGRRGLARGRARRLRRGLRALPRALWLVVRHRFRQGR